MPIDFELLFQTPFYILKNEIRSRLRRWGSDFHGAVLDVGCGSHLYKKVLNKGIHYFGLENNIKKQPEVVGNALQLPFESDCVDNLICLEVLEHVPEPEQALEEMSRVAKTGARLILSTPMSWYLHYEPHDFYRYTKYGLQHLLSKTGFRILYIEPTGALWTIIISRGLEGLFHLLYPLTAPIHWVTGKDKGRWRLALVMLLPATLLGIGLRKLLDSKQRIFVQGWVLLAEKD